MRCADLRASLHHAGRRERRGDLIRILLLGISIALATACAPVRAQGGPPLVTDDPGTPGPGNWEINTAVVTSHAHRVTYYEVPLVDVDYGVGEQLQLKYEMPWLIQNGDATSREAAGNGQIGVKWRFYDAGKDAWQISTYPQVQFGFPIGRSSRNGLADPGTSLLLPLEFERDSAFVDVDFELGRWSGKSPLSDTWIVGVAVGHEVLPEIELIAELHDQAQVAGSRSELLANVGLRWNLSDHFSLLLSAGRDLHNSLGPTNSLMTYIGLQSRF